MKVDRITRLWGAFVRFLHGCFGAGLVFILSPVVLLLAGSFPELGEHTNVELGFSLLALAGASGCVAGLISNAHRLVEFPLPFASLLVRLPAQSGPETGERPEARKQGLPVLVPSLVLPTLIAGLGGWVGFAACAPRVEARHSAV